MATSYMRQEAERERHRKRAQLIEPSPLGELISKPAMARSPPRRLTSQIP